MLKIRALNRESSSDEDIPIIRREAQEEIALELYNKALRLQAQGEYTESESILSKLIDENIPQLENNGGLPKSMSTLRFSCHLNIGNIYLKQSKINEALERFLMASELDGTDVTLWYRIGKLALKQDKFRQSAYAFSKGLQCSDSHWPCLDQLISVLFAIKDTVACLEYIGKALVLDPDYVKGLTLRKQIYQDNPATKEYYKLYNPDYIWEPPLDIHIDEEDEKTYLEEAQALTERVNEVEKTFGPKSLQVIPLPKPLDEYTWLDLAKTITYIHQYITDNEMSHFTMFDMSKSMSISPESSDKPNETKEEKETEETNSQRETECVPDIEEKMDASTVPERRFSVTSETNNENQENTPVQTDNDEEQNMDQDNEEQDDSEAKSDKSKPRASKRKRDLLSDLQIWGWHSKRKQAKKAKDKDFTVEDALNRIIPEHLLPNKIDPEKYNPLEDSMDTMDIYNLYVEDRNVNCVSPIHSPKSVHYEPYFGTDRERDDVLEFWTKERTRHDAVILVKEFVFTLSKLWHYRWPKELIPLYIKAYTMFREHCDPPQVLCSDLTFEEIRDDALATLLYGELISFSCDKTEYPHATLLGYLQLVSSWDERWKEEYALFYNRVHWLESYVFRKQNSNDLAARTLELIQEVIDAEEAKSKEKYMLSLPNCLKYGLITKQIVQKILKHLDLINSLGSVESLYNSEKYLEAAEILKQTFNCNGNHPQVGRLGRPAQLGILMHSLWFVDMSECFVWTEQCLNEAIEHYLKPKKDLEKWEKIMEKCIAILHEIIKSETVVVLDRLTDDRKVRLVENLSKIVSKQLNTENTGRIPLGCITPWILLHYVLLRNEQREYAVKRASQVKRGVIPMEDELPPSIAILFSAHEFLGPKGWCLTNQGELLHFIVDSTLDRLDTPVFEHLKDKMEVHLEQAFFCLYQHPSKKSKASRHLVDHNVDPLPLTWERALQLYTFFGPDYLPEFNSYKNASISWDFEQLLKRIMALVPQRYAPQQRLPKILDYIHGKSDEIPEPMEFPLRVQAIYYLIGDFYFKQKEFKTCTKYFQMDLCINPERLDSWACLALSYVAQLEAKLTHCEKFKHEMEFLDKSKYASICFKKALDISPDNLMLWIEYGTFQYTAHSYCSRTLKFESENLSMEKFEFLENQKNSYLDNAGRSFEKAITLYEFEEGSNEPDERWLQYYVLGKIAEKKQKEPTEYLEHYLTASRLLDENGAEYPDKINYTSPQPLSVEALELHYRIYASVLKYIELHENKEIPTSLGRFFTKCLDSSIYIKKRASTTTVPVPEQPDNTVTSVGFQEQFLNSLNKVNDGNKSEENLNSKASPEKESNNETKSVTEEVAEEKPAEFVKPKESPKPKESKEIVSEDVIMISDSDDEKTSNSKKAEEEPVKEVKDVQKVLDEMMVETMKEAEKQELDSDLSTEKVVEEVSIKEDKTEPAAKTPVEPSVKVSDSETDTDNKKTSSSSSSASSSSSSSSSESDSDDESSSSSSSSSDEDRENMSSTEISQLIDKCVIGLEICITRLTQNYKALYRLAHLYFNYKPRKDLAKSKQLLLSEYKCKDGAGVGGLFSDRKPTNFFNGIWRIPSTEIDRPGSLSAHMSRCVSLLLQILRTTNDNKTLVDLAVQLYKTPEPDKIYIKDSERLSFSDQALTMCLQSLRTHVKNVDDMSNVQISKQLQEIYKVYQRLQKHMPGKAATFGNLLSEVYRKFIKEKIPENVNVLELATKFCIQNKHSEKQKQNLISNPVVVPRNPGVAPPPVLPTPSIATAPQIVKRQYVSNRPRGRPPAPKLPGQSRPRANKPAPSMSTKAFNWQKSLLDQSYAYEYLKHYQEELIKQYSQNMSLNQMTQLGQILAQGQISNPMTAAAITNQLFAQTGLLNTGSMMKPMQSGLAGMSSAQMMESLNAMAASTSKKKAGIEQDLRLLESMTTSMKQPNPLSMKGSSPHTISSPSGIISSNAKPKSLSPTKSALDPPRSKASAVFKPSIPMFKEPAATKSSMQDEKTTKELMKDRPNISITPVTVNPPPPPATINQSGFIKPPIPCSGGKTLQEKLAEKKKEQQNKQLKSSMESFSKEVHMKPTDLTKERKKDQMKINMDMEARSTEAFMKGLNLPNIPSSLTVSKAHVSKPNISTVTKIHKPTAISQSYPLPKHPNIPKSLAGMSSGGGSWMDLGLNPATMSPIAPTTKAPVTVPPSVTINQVQSMRSRQTQSKHKHLKHVDASKKFPSGVPHNSVKDLDVLKRFSSKDYALITSKEKPKGPSVDVLRRFPSTKSKPVVRDKDPSMDILKKFSIGKQVEISPVEPKHNSATFVHRSKDLTKPRSVGLDITISPPKASTEKRSGQSSQQKQRSRTDGDDVICID